jgi:glycosyltransferase involved in cell wall biosynthesis
MNDILLTVSGIIPDDIEQQIKRGDRPQADYLALARSMQADVLDYPTARQETGWMGRALERAGGPNLMLAWACFRRGSRYRVIVTDGEQVGLPLAMLWKLLLTGRRPRHVTIAHLISASKKSMLVDFLKLHTHIEAFIVYSTWQKAFIESRWKLAPERVFFTPFMVDGKFFSPQTGLTKKLDEMLAGIERPIICSAGLEFRDYPTLLEAAQGLDVQVVIAAASPWSKRKDTTAGQALPDNVLVQRFSQYELRELYARSQLVVMPLYPVKFQAGVTAILEGMAMGKAILCSCTPGQTDIIRDGETGCYVPAQDPQALRAAILQLLSSPHTADQMGLNGRRQVESELDLEHYAKRLAHLVFQVRDAAGQQLH